jgi:formylglycine-generating enzyme required for sulfatase activity
MTNSIGMVLVLMPSGFWAGKYEVTRGEYGRVMETKVSESQNEQLPVNRVTWDDANEFCRRLTDKESAKLNGKVYSLPTVKQWDELRAGQKLDELPAGSLKTGTQAPSVVSETSTNKLGLFGVLGNVWEWCLDGEGKDGKLQKGGDQSNSSSYDRFVPAAQPRLNSGFRCVLVPK